MFVCVSGMCGCVRHVSVCGFRYGIGWCLVTVWHWVVPGYYMAESKAHKLAGRLAYHTQSPEECSKTLARNKKATTNVPMCNPRRESKAYPDATVINQPQQIQAAHKRTNGSLAGTFAKLLAPLIEYGANPCVTFYSILF